MPDAPVNVEKNAHTNVVAITMPPGIHANRGPEQADQSLARAAFGHDVAGEGEQRDRRYRRRDDQPVGLHREGRDRDVLGQEQYEGHTPQDDKDRRADQPDNHERYDQRQRHHRHGLRGQ